MYVDYTLISWGILLLLLLLELSLICNTLTTEKSFRNGMAFNPGVPHISTTKPLLKKFRLQARKAYSN